MVVMNGNAEVVEMAKLPDEVLRVLRKETNLLFNAYRSGSLLPGTWIGEGSWDVPICALHDLKALLPSLGYSADEFRAADFGNRLQDIRAVLACGNLYQNVLHVLLCPDA